MISAFECLRTPAEYALATGQPLPLPVPGPRVWPHQLGLVLRRGPTPTQTPTPGPSPEASDAEPPTPAAPEWVAGHFGLGPRWSKSLADAKLRGGKLVNAQAESAARSRPFEAAWREGQRVIVPMAAFFVDDLRSGRPVPTRIARVDGKALCVAGLWERWAKDGEERLSFCLLTVSATGHGLMHRYGHGGVEPRMPAILGDGACDAWLTAHPDKARELLRPFAAQALLANPVQQKVTAKVKALRAEPPPGS